MDALLELLACPACAGPLAAGLWCTGCGARFEAPDGIPNLRLASDQRTDAVRRFYERAPFPGYPPRDSLQALHARAERSAFARLVNHAISGDARIVEVGCGTGQMCLYLARADRVIVGADLTRAALLLGAAAAKRFGLAGVQFVETDLQQPGLRAGSFDVVYSSGVLHHTPDCRRGFAEVARVTAPGGTSVIFLYNYWNIYNLIFQLFKPFKRLVPLAKVPVGVVRLLQPFARSHFGHPLDDAQLRRLLGDKLWTPQATFHSVSEIRRWGQEEGLQLTAHKTFFLGYAIVYRFERAGTAPFGPGERTIRVRCITCKHEMNGGAEGYSCPGCGRVYRSTGGIFGAVNT